MSRAQVLCANIIASSPSTPPAITSGIFCAASIIPGTYLVPAVTVLYECSLRTKTVSVHDACPLAPNPARSFGACDPAFRRDSRCLAHGWPITPWSSQATRGHSHLEHQTQKDVISYSSSHNKVHVVKDKVYWTTTSTHVVPDRQQYDRHTPIANADMIPGVSISY